MRRGAGPRTLAARPLPALRAPCSPRPPPPFTPLHPPFFLLLQLWDSYFPAIDAIVFIIDSSDRERFPEVKTVLDELLANDKLQDKPFLILGNKCDIGGCAQESELRAIMGLMDTTGKASTARDAGVRPMELFMCSLVKRYGYGDGLKWLCVGGEGGWGEAAAPAFYKEGAAPRAFFAALPPAHPNTYHTHAHTRAQDQLRVGALGGLGREGERKKEGRALHLFYFSCAPPPMR